MKDCFRLLNIVSAKSWFTSCLSSLSALTLIFNFDSASKRERQLLAQWLIFWHLSQCQQFMKKKKKSISCLSKHQNGHFREQHCLSKLHQLCEGQTLQRTLFSISEPVIWDHQLLYWSHTSCRVCNRRTSSHQLCWDTAVQLHIHVYASLTCLHCCTRAQVHQCQWWQCKAQTHLHCQLSQQHEHNIR